MLKNLLLYRATLFNVAMASLFGYLVSKGYVMAAVIGDPTGLTLLIALIFVLLLGSTGHRMWKTVKAMNWLKDGTSSQLRTPPPGQPWTKRLVKITHIHDGASWLAYMGLIGTVIGFLLAFSGVDIGALAAVAGVKSMIPEMMKGMMVALYTTLSGAFFGIWTEVNYRMLHTATACLVEDEKRKWEDWRS